MRPLIAAALLLLGSTAIAQSGGDAALDALLEQVQAEARAQGSTLREREQAFLARRDEQRALLRQARAQVAERQRAVDALRGQIRELGETLEERQATLKERSGDLEGVAAVLRDAATDRRRFRQLLHQVARALVFEAAASIPTRPVTVESPMGPAAGVELVDQPVLIPILRAGLGMLDARTENKEAEKVGVNRSCT